MARLDIGEPQPGFTVVTVSLSRRNLLALLTKLDMEGSYRTIVTGNTYENQVETQGVMLVVRSEEDDRHYSDRAAPGPMHSATEEAILHVDLEGDLE